MRATAERRLMRMVDEALDLPETERAHFLKERCDGDAELLRRAVGLLEAAARPSEDLTPRIGAAIGAAAAAALGETPSYPERLGPYRLLEVLGEGGMGVVLAAHQDEPVSRDVAIKLIRAGTHAPGLVARFHGERQVLATLEHPNIAKLHDAGATPEGLPYFVMELIRGEPLTEYCDRRNLSLEQRLLLFRTLLGAVQHAHQKTIVHRDLKPSNVLVADLDGQPILKVIDFGIARVASGEPGLTGLTGLGGGLGTLEYMSPEQVLRPSHGADTRSDVYSLGVMLYQLVTGTLPIDCDRLRDASPTELDRILHDPVMRASRRAPAAVSGRIRGDLDAIIQAAMATDPARRYETVARFDEDLDRFLNGLPISARPSTLGYRARKFLARNRYAVAGSTLAVGILLGMAVVFTVRLADERDRAELEADKAQQIADFLQSVFEVPDPAGATPNDMTARELLDAGAARIEDLADQPDLQSALYGVVGRTYGGLGLWEEADVYLSRALDVERRTRGARSPEAADLLNSLGLMLSDAGQLDRSEEALRQALELRTALLGRAHPSTGVTLAELSLTRRALGDYEEAVTLGRESVSILRASPGADPLDLAHALHALAFVLRSRLSLDEAEALYTEALDIRRRILGDAHPQTLETLSNFAQLQEARGRYGEAEALMREVLETRRERLGEEHPLTLNALSNLAFVLWRSGQYPRATELFDEAVRLGERISSGDNPTLAIAMNNLGVAQRRIGALAESEESHRRALAMDERLFGGRHPRIAGDMDNLGRTLLALGRAQEAESLHVAALAMRTEILGESHVDRAESLSALARARLALGQRDDGMRLLEDALRIRSDALGADHPRTADVQHDLGVAELQVGAPAEAEAHLREALRIRRAALGPEHPDLAATLTEIGRLLGETSRTGEARAALEEARDIVSRRLDPSDPQRVEVERELEAIRSSPSSR